MSTLLHDIETFCAEHNLSQWQFGSMALNDKPFVSQLKAGRRIWPETDAKVREFMANYRPAQQNAAA